MVDPGLDNRLTISVVITTYNRPDYLVEAIHSIEQQTVLPTELIVVDDGSPVPVIIETSMHSKVVRQTNQGLAAARNRGFHESSGEVVMFLDDDDIYLPRRVENVLGAHQEGANIAYCGQDSFSDDPRAASESATHLLDVTYEHGLNVESLLNATTPNFGALSITRSAWLDLDESYIASQDVDWWIRLASLNNSITRIHSDDLVIRKHSGVRHINGTRARVDASIRLLQQHRLFFESHPTARSFRMARVSLMSSSLGDRSKAIGYAARSLLSRPSKVGLFAAYESIKVKRRSS